MLIFIQHLSASQNTKILALWFWSCKGVCLPSVTLQQFRLVYTVHTGNEFTCLTTGGNTKVLLSQRAAEQGRQVPALWYPDYCELRQALAHSEPWYQMKTPGCIFKCTDMCVLSDTDKYIQTWHRSNSEVFPALLISFLSPWLSFSKAHGFGTESLQTLVRMLSNSQNWAIWYLL